MATLSAEGGSANPSVDIDALASSAAAAVSSNGQGVKTEERPADATPSTKISPAREGSPKNVIDKIDSDASNASYEDKPEDPNSAGGGKSSDAAGDGAPRTLRRRSSVKPTRYEVPVSPAKKPARPRKATAAKPAPKSPPKAATAKKGGKKKVTPSPRTGMWTDKEHEQFVEGVILYGWSSWINVATCVPTRDSVQVKSHGQKFLKHNQAEVDRLIKEHNRRMKGGRSPKGAKKGPKKEAAKPRAKAKVKAEPKTKAKAAGGSPKTKSKAADTSPSGSSGKRKTPPAASATGEEGLRSPPKKRVANKDSPSKEPTAKRALLVDAPVEKKEEAPTSRLAVPPRAARSRAPKPLDPSHEVVPKKDPPKKDPAKKSQSEPKKRPAAPAKPEAPPAKRAKKAAAAPVMGSGPWTPQEQAQFENGVIIHGWRNWIKVTECVPTRTHTQVKSHAQKWHLWRQKDKARLIREHERRTRKLEKKRGKSETKTEKRKGKKDKKDKKRRKKEKKKKSAKRVSEAEAIFSPIRSPQRMTVADHGAAEAIMALNFTSWEDRTEGSDASATSECGPKRLFGEKEPGQKAGGDVDEDGAGSSGSEEEKAVTRSKTAKSKKGPSKGSKNTNCNQPAPHWLAADTWEHCQANIRRWGALSAEEKEHEYEKYDRMSGTEKERLKNKLVNLMCNPPSISTP